MKPLIDSLDHLAYCLFVFAISFARVLLWAAPFICLGLIPVVGGEAVRHIFWITLAATICLLIGRGFYIDRHYTRGHNKRSP
jgi:hypothetical protein